MALMYVLERFSVLPVADNSLGSLAEPLGSITLLFVGVIIFPLFEELLFRGYLTFPRYFGGCRLKRGFGVVFYLSSAFFAAAHLCNFSSLNPFYSIPVVIAPQFILGTFTGYIRIVFGLHWSYLFHSMHNLVFLSAYMFFGE